MNLQPDPQASRVVGVEALVHWVDDGGSSKLIGRKVQSNRVENK